MYNQNLVKVIIAASVGVFVLSKLVPTGIIAKAAIPSASKSATLSSVASDKHSLHIVKQSGLDVSDKTSGKSTHYCVVVVSTLPGNPSVPALQATEKQDSSIMRVSHLRRDSRLVRIIYPGQTGGPKAQGKILVTNENTTLGTIAFRKATHTWATCLLVVSAKGSINVVPDFNKRLANLCQRSKLPLIERYVFVTGVKGRTLHVESQEAASPFYRQYEIDVRVSKEGRLRILRHKTLS